MDSGNSKAKINLIKATEDETQLIHELHVAMGLMME